MLVAHMHKQFHIPVSVLCRRFDLPRASFYRQSTKDDRELAEKIKEIAFQHPAWGYRMIMAELSKQGISVNHKRIYRIYRGANLQKPPLVSRKKHSRITQPFEATPAEFPGHVWAADFLHVGTTRFRDRIISGRIFRIFNVLDVFTRRGFEPPADFSLAGNTIAHHLDHLCTLYGPPRVFRRDVGTTRFRDGPEFRSKEFRRTIRKWRIKEEVIPPGQPFNNGHMESYHGTMREELLDREEFENLLQAQERIKHWVKIYNTERPHSALDYKTPMNIWNDYYGP